MNVSSRNVTPTPAAPPTSRRVAGVHGFPFTISAKRASRTETTLPSCASSAIAWSQERPLVLGHFATIFGQVSERGAERGEHFRGVARVEEIDQGGVVSLEELDFQIGQEPADGEPEIVAHQNDCLRMLAVALTQGGDQLGAFLAAPGVKPLLELVDHEQELATRAEHAAFAHGRKRIDQPGAGRAGRGKPFSVWPAASARSHRRSPRRERR